MSWSHNRAAPVHGPGETRHCGGAWGGRRTGSGPSVPGTPLLRPSPPRLCAEMHPVSRESRRSRASGGWPHPSELQRHRKLRSLPFVTGWKLGAFLRRDRPHPSPVAPGGHGEEDLPRSEALGSRLSALSSRRIVGRPGAAGRRSPVRSECPPATRPASSLDGGQPQRHRTVGSPNVTGRAGMTVSLGRVFAGRVLGLNAGRVASKSVIACSSRRVRPMSSSPSMRRQRV